MPLTSPFDVAQWLARARECIAAITARGRVSVVCGGTGLYIRALTHGLAPLPGATTHAIQRAARDVSAV